MQVQRRALLIHNIQRTCPETKEIFKRPRLYSPGVERCLQGRARVKLPVMEGIQEGSLLNPTPLQRILFVGSVPCFNNHLFSVFLLPQLLYSMQNSTPMKSILVLLSSCITHDRRALNIISTEQRHGTRSRPFYRNSCPDFRSTEPLCLRRELSSRENAHPRHRADDVRDSDPSPPISSGAL